MLLFGVLRVFIMGSKESYICCCFRKCCNGRLRQVYKAVVKQVQGPRDTKDVTKMVPVVPLFNTEYSKGKILALSQELR